MTRPQRLIHQLAPQRLAILCAALMTAGLAVAGCTDDQEMFSTPRSYTVDYDHHCYVGYEYDAHEADMLGVPATCTRVLYPSYEPTFDYGDYMIRLLLWEHLLRYNGFYHYTPYFDRYIAPMASRYPGAVVVNRNSYITTNTSFNTRNAAVIRTNAKTAVWADGKKGARTLPTQKAPAKAAVSNTKRDTGTTNSRDTYATKPKAPVAKPAAPAPVRRR